jgi:hypothetical protein
MPINIPSGLYTGGRATFDTSSMTNAILKDLASQKAAKEAIVKNAKSLAFKLNPAGLRKDVDLPEFNKRATEWYNNAVGGNLDYGKYQELLNDIEVGKKRVETIAKAGELALNRKIEMDANDVAILDNLNKSIYDPASRKADGNEFGLGDLSPNIPTVDPTKRNAIVNSLFTNVERTADINKIRKGAPGYLYVTEEIAPNKKKEVADRSAPLASSLDMQKTYRELMKDPTFMAEAGKAYQDVYGKGAVIDSPTKAFQAEVIMAANTIGKERAVSDKEYEYKIWNEKFEKTQGRIDRRTKERIAASGGAGAPIVDRYTPVVEKIKANNNVPVSLKSLDIGTQEDIMGKMKDKSIYREDVYLDLDAKTGEVRILEKTTNAYEPQGTWGRVTANIEETPGVKGKQEIAKAGEAVKTTPPAAPKSKATIKGKSGKTLTVPK